MTEARSHRSSVKFRGGILWQAKVDKSGSRFVCDNRVVYTIGENSIQ